jgi:hypothetical protein
MIPAPIEKRAATNRGQLKTKQHAVARTESASLRNSACRVLLTLPLPVTDKHSDDGSHQSNNCGKYILQCVARSSSTNSERKEIRVRLS